jgi:phosphoglycerol transferase MdoB-like AlkP superfamily enzyme
MSDQRILTREPIPYLSLFLQNCKLWLLCMFVLLVCRLGFLLALDFRLDSSAQIDDLLAALQQGFRFDSRFTTLWFLPLLAFDAWHRWQPMPRLRQRLQLSWVGLYLTLSMLLSVVLVSYYQEYDDVFNFHLFGLVEDDTQAVLLTLYKEYALLPKLLLVMVLGLVLVGMLQAILRAGPHVPLRLQPLQRYRSMRVLLMLIMLVLILAAARGSFGGRPVQEKDSAVTANELLNKSVLMPHASLYYTLRQYQELNSGEGFEALLPGGDIRGATQAYFNTQAMHDDLDQYLRVQAGGPKGKVPKHVFLLVMESYHSWPMLDEYASLQLAEGVKGLAREGAWLRNFLPASHSTMRTLQSIISGLPAGGLRINLEPNSYEAYPTSLPAIFNRLGYDTHFFYGGYLSWHRVGNFADDQGFAHIHGGGHMEDYGRHNEWGVDDRGLFNYMEQALDPQKPSLSVVLSTTNHAPYDLKLRAEGFPLKALPDEIAEQLNPKLDAKQYLRQLGHFWYADREVTRFVRETAKRFPDSLFVITGDHYGRDHVLANPPIYDRNSVPLVLYGPDVLKGIEVDPQRPGGQLDLLATLVEMVAPEGFEYHRVGQDLLAASDDVAVAIGDSVVITAEFVVRRDGATQALPGGRNPDAAEVAALAQLHDQHQAIGWWRVRNGEQLPAQ